MLDLKVARHAVILEKALSLVHQPTSFWSISKNNHSKFTNKKKQYRLQLLAAQTAECVQKSDMFSSSDPVHKSSVTFGKYYPLNRKVLWVRSSRQNYRVPVPDSSSCPSSPWFSFSTLQPLICSGCWMTSDVPPCYTRVPRLGSCLLTTCLFLVALMNHHRKPVLWIKPIPWIYFLTTYKGNP